MARSSSQQPPTKRAKHNFSQSFDVLVGPEKEKFNVVHDVLTTRSGFFEAARSLRWKSDPSSPTDLTDHDPQTFSAYLQIVYTGTLVCSDATLSQWYDGDCPADRWDDMESAHHSHLEHLIKLYALADKLEDLISANIVMDSFLKSYDKSKLVLSFSMIVLIYDHTPPESPLRNLVRDTVMYETNSDWYDKSEEDELPHALLFDIVKEYAVTKEAQGETSVSEAYPNHILRERSECHYHQHNDKNPECK